MTRRARSFALALSVLLTGMIACSQQEQPQLTTQDIDLFKSKLNEKGSMQAACKELDVLCKTTGFGCKAHEIFCNVPTKEYICQQLAAACATYPAACDVYTDHCKDNPSTDGGLPPPDAGSSSCPACTDPTTCCKPADMVCVGTPDKGVVCSCPTLWDCSTGPCKQQRPAPTVTDTWSCSWTATSYACSASAPPAAPPGSTWSCKTTSFGYICHAPHPPTPCNRQDGASFWSCQVDSGNKLLSCTPVGTTPPPGDCGNAFESELRTLVNAERVKASKPPLACNLALVKVAHAHAQAMCDQQFFSHTDPAGKMVHDRVTAAGIPYADLGENLAAAQKTPAEVMKLWINSPPHRNNILGPYDDFGGGYVACAGGTFPSYWTQVFLRR